MPQYFYKDVLLVCSFCLSKGRNFDVSIKLFYLTLSSCYMSLGLKKQPTFNC
jgi:hypothetical protein